EFINKVTLREVNFGKEITAGGTFKAGGKEFIQSGFNICSGCGRVQDINKKFEHTFSCRYKKNNEKGTFNSLFLYRDFTSEAIRILLPVSLFEKEKMLHSFSAAINLGLKKKFRGNPAHLGLTVYDEPEPDSDFRKNYLLLYDTVPGGTGYLKELMETKEFIEVLNMALDTLKACKCNREIEKDGCYSCIYAYRGRYDFTNTSREEAVNIISSIIDRKDKITEITTISDIQINKLLESELEARFIKRLSTVPGFKLSKALINGKCGWLLLIDNNPAYNIEPQVKLNIQDGINIPSRADFVFWPIRSLGKPVALFTDGYEYHGGKLDKKSRLGKDTAQRMSIIKSNKFIVWSLTWDDIVSDTDNGDKYFENYLNNKTSRFSDMLSKEMRLFIDENLINKLKDHLKDEQLKFLWELKEKKLWLRDIMKILSDKKFSKDAIKLIYESLENPEKKINGITNKIIKKHKNMAAMNSFELLLIYLAMPEIEIWEKIAFYYGILLLDIRHNISSELNDSIINDFINTEDFSAWQFPSNDPGNIKDYKYGIYEISDKNPLPLV
ncbi:MAG: DUF1998 domain-containing protein, partial [Candidatus Eremiobacterota bacterium]